MPTKLVAEDVRNNSADAKRCPCAWRVLKCSVVTPTHPRLLRIVARRPIQCAMYRLTVQVTLCGGPIAFRLHSLCSEGHIRLASNKTLPVAGTADHFIVLGIDLVTLRECQQIQRPFSKVNDVARKVHIPFRVCAAVFTGIAIKARSLKKTRRCEESI